MNSLFQAIAIVGGFFVVAVGVMVVIKRYMARREARHKRQRQIARQASASPAQLPRSEVRESEPPAERPARPVDETSVEETSEDFDFSTRPSRDLPPDEEFDEEESLGCEPVKAFDDVAADEESGADEEGMLPEMLVPAAVTDRGTFKEQPDPVRDPVDCTVFAPPEAASGDTLLVQIFAHTPLQAEQAKAAAQEFDTDAERRGFTSLGTEIARGSRLTFELVMKGLAVDDPVQELVWQGRPESAQFEVEVPANARPRTIIGKVLISQDTIPIGTIRFKLKLVAEQAVEAAEGPTGEAYRYRRAFVSYASQDRPEVLRRVQMLTAVGIEFFQDVLNLDPGTRWAKELYRHIDESDVLFLFWSSAAKQSEWVCQEWQYALKCKGDDFIRPVIIEGPPPVPPPPELSHLHFNDKVLYFMVAG